MKAAGLHNVAVQTALLVLHEERIILCNNVSLDTDCSLCEFRSAVDSLYT